MSEDSAKDVPRESSSSLNESSEGAGDKSSEKKRTKEDDEGVSLPGEEEKPQPDAVSTVAASNTEEELKASPETQTLLKDSSVDKTADAEDSTGRGRRNVITKGTITGTSSPSLSPSSNNMLVRQRSNSSGTKKTQLSPLTSILFPSPLPNQHSSTSHLRRRSERILMDHHHRQSIVEPPKIMRASSILELPRVILLIIFSELSLKDIARCSQVCTYFRFISDDRKIMLYGRPRGRTPREQLRWVCEQREEKCKVLSISVDIFNEGETQAAIQDLINSYILQDTPFSISTLFKSPEAMANMAPKRKLDYLFDKENAKVLEEYVGSYNYKRLDITDGLRKMLEGLGNVPEGKLQLLMERFGQAYHKQNEPLPNYPFASAFAVSNFARQTYLIVFNEDHTRRFNLPDRRKFFEAVRGINNGKSLPDLFLESVYCRVVHLKLDYTHFPGEDNNGPSVVKTGWMSKSSDKELFKLKKKRWFMLINRSLFYYRKPGDDNYLGRITLCDVFVDKVPAKGRKNSFKLEWPQFKGLEKKPSLQFLFVTDSDEECDQWVNVLNENIFYSNHEAFHMRQHLQQTQYGVLHAVTNAIGSSINTGMNAIGTSFNAIGQGLNALGSGITGVLNQGPNGSPRPEKYPSESSIVLPVVEEKKEMTTFSPPPSRRSKQGSIDSEKDVNTVYVRRASKARLTVEGLLYSCKVQPLPYFGVPLDVIVEREGSEVPALVELAIKYITDKALKEEGILRLSGSLAEVNAIRSQIERDGIINFHGQDPHVVANVLKAFLRELPEPLIPTEINSGIIAILNYGEGAEVLAEMKNIFELLSPTSMKLLKRLIDFMMLVAAQSDLNKMNTSNLMIVMTPALKIAPGIFSIPMSNYDYFFGSNQSPPNTPSPPPSTAPSTTTENTTETKAAVVHDVHPSESARRRQRDFIGNRRGLKPRAPSKMKMDLKVVPSTPGEKEDVTKLKQSAIMEQELQEEEAEEDQKAIEEGGMSDSELMNEGGEEEKKKEEEKREGDKAK